MENVFGLRLIGITNVTASELSINDALLTIGYGGALPIQSLESTFMTMYFKTTANNNSRSRKAPVYFSDEIFINNTKVTNIQKKTINFTEENIVGGEELTTGAKTKPDVQRNRERRRQFQTLGR